MPGLRCLILFYALAAAARFAGLLNGRQQHADQNADNGDDHQQFNDGKRRVEIWISQTSLLSSGFNVLPRRVLTAR